MGGGGDGDRAFDHAADHDAQVMGASDMDHFQGAVDASAFHILDVDAVNMPDQPGDIIDGDGAFIGDDGERDIVAHQLESGEIVGRYGLFHKLYIVRGQSIDLVNGLFR